MVVKSPLAWGCREIEAVHGVIVRPDGPMGSDWSPLLNPPWGLPPPGTPGHFCEGYARARWATPRTVERGRAGALGAPERGRARVLGSPEKWGIEGSRASGDLQKCPRSPQRQDAVMVARSPGGCHGGRPVDVCHESIVEPRGVMSRPEGAELPSGSATPCCSRCSRVRVRTSPQRLHVRARGAMGRDQPGYTGYMGGCWDHVSDTCPSSVAFSASGSGTSPVRSSAL